MFILHITNYNVLLYKKGKKIQNTNTALSIMTQCKTISSFHSFLHHLSFDKLFAGTNVFVCDIGHPTVYTYSGRSRTYFDCIDGL